MLYTSVIFPSLRERLYLIFIIATRVQDIVVHVLFYYRIILEFASTHCMRPVCRAQGDWAITEPCE